MEFLSKEGLSHLVDKIKGSFVTKKEFEKKTKKKVEETICVRKAIKLNSVFHHVSYYHASLNDIPINLTFSKGNGAGEKKKYNGGYYRFKDTKGRFPIKDLYNQSLTKYGYNSKVLGNNVFQVSEVPAKGKSWVNWQIAFDKDVIEKDLEYFPNIIKVVDVSIVEEDGKEIVEVTLSISSAKKPIYDGKTSSPYFGLYNGVVRPMMGKEEKLPFEGINHIKNTFTDFKYIKGRKSGMSRRNIVALYIKRKYTNKNPKSRVPKSIHRYKLSNRMYEKDNIWKGGSYCYKGGQALVKCYHRGICVSTRHLFINRYNAGEEGEKYTFTSKA